MSVGSLPLPSDVSYLKSKNVRGVINMCWEYNGPLKEYNNHKIQQIHLPTSDLTEPSVSDMLLAVQFVQKIREQYPHDRIFIHCKG